MIVSQSAEQQKISLRCRPADDASPQMPVTITRDIAIIVAVVIIDAGRLSIRCHAGRPFSSANKAWPRLTDIYPPIIAPMQPSGLNGRQALPWRLSEMAGVIGHRRRTAGGVGRYQRHHLFSCRLPPGLSFPCRFTARCVGWRFVRPLYFTAITSCHPLCERRQAVSSPPRLAHRKIAAGAAWYAVMANSIECRWRRRRRHFTVRSPERSRPAPSLLAADIRGDEMAQTAPTAGGSDIIACRHRAERAQDHDVFFAAGEHGRTASAMGPRAAHDQPQRIGAIGAVPCCLMILAT